MSKIPQTHEEILSDLRKKTRDQLLMIPFKNLTSEWADIANIVLAERETEEDRRIQHEEAEATRVMQREEMAKDRLMQDDAIRGASKMHSKTIAISIVSVVIVVVIGLPDWLPYLGVSPSKPKPPLPETRVRLESADAQENSPPANSPVQAGSTVQKQTQ